MMTNKEEAFLQYYVAAGLNAGKKVECYRLAFGKEVDGVQDSSLETYAKRLLATKEAKAYIKKHRPNDVVRSEQLLDAIKELHELLQVNDKVSDILAIRREIRLHLADLAKCVDVIEAGKADEWAIAESFMKITTPVDVTNEGDLKKYIQHLTQGTKRPKLFIVKGNQIKELLPLSTEGISSAEIEDFITNEKFALAFRTG